MIQLQKAIIAIGMFSLFDSILQKGLARSNGFEEAKKMLIQTGNKELLNRFEDFICAINVLKHGQGRSYNALVAKSDSLPFKIKLPGENFFDEAEVSEISPSSRKVPLCASSLQSNPTHKNTTQSLISASPRFAYWVCFFANATEVHKSLFID